MSNVSPGYIVAGQSVQYSQTSACVLNKAKLSMLLVRRVVAVVVVYVEKQNRKRKEKSESSSVPIKHDI